MKNARHICRRLFMKDYNLVNIVAHHESGHAVLGHLFGHLIAEINVNFDIKKKTPAFTLKQYGQDSTIINALEKKYLTL